MLVLGVLHIFQGWSSSSVDVSSITVMSSSSPWSENTAQVMCLQSMGHSPSARKPWANLALQNLSCFKSFVNWPLVTWRYSWTCDGWGDVEKFSVALRWHSKLLNFQLSHARSPGQKVHETTPDHAWVGASKSKKKTSGAWLLPQKRPHWISGKSFNMFDRTLDGFFNVENVGCWKQPVFFKKIGPFKETHLVKL